MTGIELRGKRALVTGAGRRLGAETARVLGAAGMHIGVHFHSSGGGAEATCAAIRAAGGQAVALQADLGSRDAARELVDRALAELGGLDVLVLSAAEFVPASLESIDDASWDRTLGLNLATPFAIAQRAAPALRASRGSIVGITCISRLAPYRGFLPYEVSKAGLWQMLRVLALELAPEVRVNMVAPGSVLPPESMTEAQLAELRSRIPLGRFGSARDIADAVLHLATHEHMTGSEIVIDGGRALG